MRDLHGNSNTAMVSRPDAIAQQEPTSSTPGYIIAIDGPDYCGKGTQHRMIIDYLLDHPQDRERKIINVFATREPFNTPHAIKIRDMLRHNAVPNDGGWTFAKEFTADRRIHMGIVEHLKKAGVTTVTDRYKYSTFAYQSLQGVPLTELQHMHEGLPIPDLVFFMMTSLTERLRRKAAQRDRPYDEVFERDNAFQAALQNKYYELKDFLPEEPIILLDGDRTKEEIQTEIRAHVDKLLFG